MSLRKLHPALGFLRRLAENNDRAWFQAHKDEYDAVREQWLSEVDRLIARLAQHDPRASRLTTQLFVQGRVGSGWADTAEGLEH